jgi:hypothetical protein
MNQNSTISDTQTEDIINSGGAQATPPGAKDLKAMADNIAKMLLEPMRQRGDRSNELIRELRVKEKEREQRERIREQEAREAEERRIKTKKVTPKKRGREEEHRPPAIGAHGLARQDGEMMKGMELELPDSPRTVLGGVNLPELWERENRQDTVSLDGLVRANHLMDLKRRRDR